MEKGVNRPESSGEPRRLATLLKPDALERFCRFDHLQPSSDLSLFVLVAWTMQWTLPDGQTFTHNVLPNPSVHLVISADAAEVLGVVTGAFPNTMTGTGYVFGLRFRPAGFYAFARKPVSEITDRRYSLADFLPDDTTELLKRLAADRDSKGILQVLERQLRKLQPMTDDPTRVELELLIQRLADDAEMRTVEDAAKAFGVSSRTLQRLFRLYVGVGPKWVIRRFRLKDAAARLEAGQEQDWASIAQELGYFDQSHLIKDFRVMIGESPAAYLRSRSATPDSRLVSGEDQVHGDGDACRRKRYADRDREA